MKKTTVRPIELVHDFKFIPCCFPQDAPLPSPKERLDRLKALGYGGVALCPDYGDYLSEKSIAETFEAIKYANEIGLCVWIYDEKYYASGTADGTVPRDDPRLEAKGLCAVVGEPDSRGTIYVNSPHGYGSVLYAFAVTTDENGAPLFETAKSVMEYKTFGGGILFDTKGHSNVRVYAFFSKTVFEFACTSHNTRGMRRYVDTLMPESTEAFLHKTFDGYASHGDLSEYVEAVFTDEPQIPALCRIEYRSDDAQHLKSIENSVFVVYDEADSAVALTPYFPWTERLPEVFYERHGYDLIPLLPRAFFDEGEEGCRVRADFWDTASAMFADSYGDVYANFCKEKNVKYSGHLLYEEEFDIHPYIHGDPLVQLGKMDIPGCDMLYSLPEEILARASAIKLAASASFLYGKNGVMIEASNIVNAIKNGIPIKENALKLATAIEAALGATRFLSYYTETAMEESAMRSCCDFTERILLPTVDRKTDNKVYVYLPNADIAGEAYPSVALNDKKPASEKLSAIKDFLCTLSELLPQYGIDFCFINDERLDALKDSKLFESAVLVLAPGSKKPCGSEAFAEIICETNAPETVQTLRSMGLSCAETKNGQRLIASKRTSSEKEVWILVSKENGYEGTLKLSVGTDLSSVTLYDPYTDVNTELPITGNTVLVKIPENECRLIISGK